MFKALKIATVILALAIPVSAFAAKDNPIITGMLGALIALIEAIQQMNQYNHNWITYRSTCESLKHEKYLFLGEAGHYSSADNPKALLAERVESLVSQEHAKWASAQEQAHRIQGRQNARS
jgi:Protein of unknown function (DUF4231)